MKLLAILVAFFLAANAFAASSFEIESITDKHHITADRTLYHSREGVYEAFGHVVVSSQGQRLSCDYLWIDEKTREMKARGNVVFVDKESTIQAAEIHFNLTTGFGSIFYGKVSNDAYSLKGQLIRKVSEDRFLTTEGEYTTCKDCAESWKLAARNVDMTLDGYAFMDSVFIKIKDIPTLYIPYLVVPVKTRRQSGLLFPRIAGSINNHGFVYVQPLYWAIDDHQDLTLGLGRYSARGTRYEVQYRYQSYDGIKGELNLFRTNDRDFKFGTHRSAIRAENDWPIAKNLLVRWRVNEIFDRDYILDFPEDMPSRNLPALESNGLANLPFDDFFLSVEAKRYRNLMNDSPVSFDGGTVQALPTVHLGVKERRLFGPLLGSLYGRYDAYRRHNGAYFDSDRNKFFDRGRDTLRETNRLILQPEISAPFRLGSFLRLGPSVQYNDLRYSFSVPINQGNVPSTETRYVQAKLEASTVIERVFNYDGVNVSRVKHQLTPFLTFSSIPWISQGITGHPFNGANGQLDKPAGLFDQYDIVPLTNDTNFLRYPQGKSIYYGFTSRLIRKLRSDQERGPRVYPFDLVKEKPKEYPKPLNRKMELANERQQLWDKYDPRYGEYQEIWTVNVTQAYDFKNAERRNLFGEVDRKRAFSYVLAKSDLNVDQFGHNLEYRFFPRIVNRTLNAGGVPTGETVFSNKHFVSTSATWYITRLTNLRATRSFVRSISGNFTIAPLPNPSRTVGGSLDWSFNDFLNLKLNYAYDLFSKHQTSWGAQTTLTHHSECWGVLFRYDWLRNRQKQSEVGFELLLNLMGTGFLGSSTMQGGGPAGVFGGI
jgi:LPS-assembly protein